MDETRLAAGSEARTAPVAGAKRLYTVPRLKDYGTVAELTRGGAGTTLDGRASKKVFAP